MTKKAKTVIDESMDVWVFPDVAIGPLAKRWAIFDPEHLTSAELTKLGFSAPWVNVGDDLSAVDVLIVGSRALTETSRLPATAADIARGLRVVVFEQSAAALHAMGFRTEDIVPRYAFGRAVSHPVLADIQPDDLINWRGAGTLVPATKRNIAPSPDARMHWGNHGSVASVVIETPHHGAFTPIIESCFDLAYSPLLEWRHGSGSVLFVQLDVTGRVGLEPAADALVGNIISYLDGPTLAGPDAARGLALIGTDAADQALIDSLGFTQRPASPTSLDLQPGEIVVIGRGATASLTATSREQLQEHVTAGGTVVFLPRTASEIGASSWPWTIATTARHIARVRPSGPETALTRAMGPQLTHWRTYLDLDMLSALPAGAQLSLDGLLGRMSDGDGQWVLSQFDWRALDAGGNNTRRPRWNARKLYRQLFTNLGAATRTSTASGLLPDTPRATKVVVGPWRGAAGAVLGNATQAGNGGYNFEVLPGTNALFALDPWPTAIGPSWGTVIQPDDSGFVNLAPITPNGNGATGPTAGQSAYARTYVYASSSRTATFEIAPAYWMVLKLDGKPLIDDSLDGCAVPSPGTDIVRRVSATLTPGWHKLEVVVICAWQIVTYGIPRPKLTLGFTMRVEDPGDLVIDAAPSGPTSPPAAGTPQFATTPVDLYVERKPEAEDVYRFHYY